MWEAVTDEAKLALLNVLLDGVEEFFFGDLKWSQTQFHVCNDSDMLRKAVSCLIKLQTSPPT